MGVAWFSKSVGSELAPSTEEEGLTIALGSGAPDWVRLPPQLGGRVRRCLRTELGRCPTHEHEVVHYILEGGVSVAECPESGFLWYREQST